MIDVWCMGVTLYAMLIGRLPFDEKSEADTQRNIMQIKYQIKKPISREIKEIFNLIFVEMDERASIETL
jgi:serine/threonine protein kinase